MIRVRPRSEDFRGRGIERPGESEVASRAVGVSAKLARGLRSEPGDAEDFLVLSP
jgi:hypothetical protein